jgi:hypothetical protein
MFKDQLQVISQRIYLLSSQNLESLKSSWQNYFQKVAKIIHSAQKQPTQATQRPRPEMNQPGTPSSFPQPDAHPASPAIQGDLEKALNQPASRIATHLQIPAPKKPADAHPSIPHPSQSPQQSLLQRQNQIQQQTMAQAQHSKEAAASPMMQQHQLHNRLQHRIDARMGNVAKPSPAMKAAGKTNAQIPGHSSQATISSNNKIPQPSVAGIKSSLTKGAKVAQTAGNSKVVNDPIKAAALKQSPPSRSSPATSLPSSEKTLQVKPLDPSTFIQTQSRLMKTRNDHVLDAVPLKKIVDYVSGVLLHLQKGIYIVFNHYVYTYTCYMNRQSDVPRGYSWCHQAHCSV